MQLTIESAIAFINASLAPAVLFTGVGLLLAGLQAKYSTIVTVIRQLNLERRELDPKSVPGGPERLGILTAQLDSLMQRAKLVRNSVCAFYLTIFFLVGSSILIGLRVLGMGLSIGLVFTIFGLALANLFAGIVFATREALLSYRIVEVEVRQWKE